MSRRPIRPGIRATPPEPDAAGAEAAAALRDALARWATGVTVVALREEGDVVATTATAFAPVSLEPPLVLVCIGPNAAVLPFLEPGAAFHVSILAADQRRAAAVAAEAGPLVRRLFPPDGDAVLPGAIAALSCSVLEVHPGGDHRIIVGLVERVRAGPPKPPLVYFEREYRGLR